MYSLPAQHGHFAEDCFIYVIKDPTGKTLLYGHDTGYLIGRDVCFLEANKFILIVYQWIARGRPMLTRWPII